MRVPQEEPEQGDFNAAHTAEPIRDPRRERKALGTKDGRLIQPNALRQSENCLLEN